MNVILISKETELFSVGERLIEEGHRVVIIPNQNTNSFYSNREGVMVIRLERGGRTIPDAYNQIMREFSPTVGIGSIGVGRYVEEFRRRGVRMWGGGVWADATHYNQTINNLLNRDHKVEDPFFEIMWNGVDAINFFTYYTELGLMDGGIGPRILSGLYSFAPSNKFPHLCPFTHPITSLLQKSGYIGQASFGTEINIGFSLPRFVLKVEMSGGKVGRLLLGEELLYKHQYGFALLCLMFWREENNTPIPREMRKHVWVMGRGETSDIKFAWVTAAGASRGEARGRVRRTIKNLREMFPEVMYRSDLL